MARILADTNIWLRIADSEALQHDCAVNAVARLLADGHEICICPQNVIEFWAVATRPVNANGLGWSPDEAAAEVEGLESRFVLLADIPEIFRRWKSLVQSDAIRGKRTHDARLAAVYLAHAVDGLLTFNGTDFDQLPGLRLHDPADVERDGVPTC
jgi:predicted nucleic acid-binding protein